MRDAEELLDFVRRKIDELQRELALWRELRDALAQIAGKRGRVSGFITADALLRQNRKPVAAEWKGDCVTLSLGAPARRGTLSWLEERLARRLNLSVVWQADGDMVSAVELCGVRGEEARKEVERALKWLERRLGS